MSEWKYVDPEMIRQKIDAFRTNGFSVRKINLGKTRIYGKFLLEFDENNGVQSITFFSSTKT